MEVSSLRHASVAYTQEDSLIPLVDGDRAGLRDTVTRTQSGLRVARKLFRRRSSLKRNVC